ncbi:MAG: helix-turn-helix domain-containing protein [Eubacteriales bacterium]|nr:helix-turn-helix domain-containing protein [Eubacteriales bacterium]
MVDVNKLREKIGSCGMNITEMAEKVGIDKATFYRKLSANGATFSIKEVDAMARVLKMDKNEVNKIFFTQYVADVRR